MPIRPPVFRPPHWKPEAVYRREQERLRRARDPWRYWYVSERWKAMRDAVLRAQPVCQRCRRAPSTVAHHVVPHRGDATLFWTGKLEAVCASCHNGLIQSEEAKDRAGGFQT